MPYAQDLDTGEWVEVDAQGNPVASAPKAQGRVFTLPVSPKDSAREDRDASASNRDDIRTDIAVRGEGRDIGKVAFDQAAKLRDDYSNNTQVKAYEAAVPMYVTALKTSPDRAGDLLFVTAFAKMSDPTTGVLGGEREGVATGSQSFIENKQAELRSLMDAEGGNFSDETRTKLRLELNNLMAARARAYMAQRERFMADAKSYGIDPARVVGPNVSDADRDFVHSFWEQQQGGKQPEGDSDIYTVTGPGGKKVEFTAPRGASDDEIRNLGIAATKNPALKGSQVNRPQEGYQDSYVGQGMSGVNGGLATGVLGAPVDLLTAGLNLIPQGINAVANTDIPTIQNPVGGGEWFKDLADKWAIYDESKDPSKQFVRRMGESVGAAVGPAGFAGSLPRAGAALLAGAGGGAGAATAQQVAPGNPMAEVLGEVVGGGATGFGLAKFAQRGAQRGIEAKIPTTPELRQQAGDLYQQAETRGVTAGPMQTQMLRDEVEKTLRSEGQIGPAGKITDADTNTTKAFNLIDQYAGQPMRPVEMDTVRGVIGDGRKSMDPSDQRLAGILTKQFDDWASPMAPEFDQARDIASRYLQAEELEKARELAEASASQFGGSGLENALRTQYRGLDKADIKGQKFFGDDVSEAIQNVNRGTPVSNAARNLGRFAPTGPVSLATSVGVPGLVGGAVGGPVGGALGATLGLAGAGGRVVANAATNRAVDVAELIARNGGKVPQAPLLPPEFQKMMALVAASEAQKYGANR